MDEKNSETHIELGNLFKENCNYELAEIEYEKYLKNNPENKEVLLNLIQIYNFQGKHEAAQKIASSVLKDFSVETFFGNQLLNELEISQKKLVLQSKPRIILITLTNRCNLNCPMCGRGDKIWEISSQIRNEILRWIPFLELITWQGGEVFLSDSFKSLFEKARLNKNLKQIIITNALLIDEGWAEKLVLSNNVDLTISIDSVNKKTYEYIRRGAKFEGLIKNLNLINRIREKHSSKMQLTLRCTIMKSYFGM